MPSGRVKYLIKLKKLLKSSNIKLSMGDSHKLIEFKEMVSGSYFGEIEIVTNKVRQFVAICA
jgi:hypothetical protein